MLASQLRGEIYCNCSSAGSQISSYLILEALTTRRCCENLSLERMELLGDSVLKYALGCHLFLRYPKKHEGQLSDHRTQAVCNATLHKLGTDRFLQVLGDIVESIAGAVLIETDLNLDKVWEVFEPLLSPIITPDNLAFPPLRELIELCSNLGYFIKTKCSTKGEEFAAELTVQLKDDLLVGHGCNKNTKAAKAEAALCLLKDLRERGISHTRSLSKRISCEDKSFEKPCISSLRDEISLPQKFSGIVGPNSTKSPMPETSMPFRSDASSFLTEEACHSEKLSNPKVIEKVDLSVRMQKGGARSALFDLCKILQWPAPKFETTEEKFRTPIIVSGIETRHFNIFVSTITLHIPKTAVIRLVGEQKTDKRRSQDSAAMAMLLELQKQGRCAIREQFCTQLYNILFQLTGYHWILS